MTPVDVYRRHPPCASSKKTLFVNIQTARKYGTLINVDARRYPPTTFSRHRTCVLASDAFFWDGMSFLSLALCPPLH